MTVSLLFASQVNAVVYLIPLLAVISLVYNATRYELPQIIIQRSIRFFFPTRRSSDLFAFVEFVNRQAPVFCTGDLPDPAMLKFAAETF